MRKGLLLIPLLLLAQTALAAWNPPGWEKAAPKEAGGQTAPGALLANGLLAFYRTAISPLNEGKCPSHPSCSTYALLAVEKHGPLLGSVLTAARLVGEADEAAFSVWVKVAGRDLVWYPVEESLIPGGGSK